MSEDRANCSRRRTIGIGNLARTSSALSLPQRVPTGSGLQSFAARSSRTHTYTTRCCMSLSHSFTRIYTQTYIKLIGARASLARAVTPSPECCSSCSHARAKRQGWPNVRERGRASEGHLSHALRESGYAPEFANIRNFPLETA